MTEEDPIKILKVRLAKGEITTSQFEEMITYLLDDVSSSQKEPVRQDPPMPGETVIRDPVVLAPDLTEDTMPASGNIATGMDPAHTKLDYDTDEPLGDDPIPDDIFPSGYLDETRAAENNSAEPG